jgi:hypothetical protein
VARLLFVYQRKFFAEIRPSGHGKLRTNAMSRFEITVRYTLFALMAGIFTAGVIYIYWTYR